jgi:hypothetical protein
MKEVVKAAKLKMILEVQKVTTLNLEVQLITPPKVVNKKKTLLKSK